MASFLLADVSDGRARGRLADRERCHPVEVRDRPDQLVDEVAVRIEGFHGGEA